MENISFKEHPPWYARGTPVNNTRDGPPMAMNDKTLFANPITIGCEGPSARGEPGEVGRPKLEDRSRKNEVTRLPARKTLFGGNVIVWQGSPDPDSYRGEARRSGNPKENIHLWLTLKTTFFNTQNSVYSRRCALLLANFTCRSVSWRIRW